MDLVTTRDVPAHRRFAHWQSAVCDTFVQLDCQHLSDRPFEGAITTVRAPEVNFSKVASRDQRVERNSRRLRSGYEEVLLVQLQLSGQSVVAQDDRSTRLNPGDFAIYDSTRPYILEFRDDFEVLVMHMPRERLLGRSGRTDKLTAHAIRGDSVMGALAVPFLRHAGEAISSVNPSTAAQLGSIALGLVNAALGELCVQQAEDVQSWSRSALLYRAKVIIDEQLGEPELNSAAIARELGISARYLQDLFHAENITVSDCIWTRRLERCRRELADPLLARKQISQIALDSGFSHFGHFSSRFKAAYDLSPRDYRKVFLKE